MKKKLTAILLVLFLLCPYVSAAMAENDDVTEEDSIYEETADVVEEKSTDDYDESIPAAEALTVEFDEPEGSAGTGSFDGPTEWFDETYEEDLLKGFAEQKLNQERGFVQSSFYAGRRLVSSQPGQASVYFLLKQEVEMVANGERTSTIFSGPVSELTDYGLIDKTRYTAAELGYEVIDEKNKSEVIAVMLERMDLKNIGPAVRALLADCPYELYWFDKTSTGGYTFSFQYEYDKDESGASYIEITGYTFRLAAAEKYAVAKYEVTTEYADAVNSAIRNAREIAEAASYYSDVGKLEYYLEQICMLASYNTAATHSGLPYGDPWQIIYVFDGDPSTKVVCEGYAKAFAYLCELSSFSEAVEWYTVTGKTTEKHMWNIVCLNGNNFLVDPTNCDDGAIGQGKQLFLVGYDEGSVEQGYTIHCISGTMRYQYDSAALGAFSKADLNLVPRGTDPHAPVKNGLTLDNDGVWRYYDRNVFIAFSGIAEYGGARFFVAEGFLCSEAEGLNCYKDIWYFLYGGQIQEQYTGLAIYDGEWFYVVEGILNMGMQGLLDYDGGRFLVSNGQIRRDVSGLWLNDSTALVGGDDSWYYLAKGQVQTQYTGLAEYDGAWFYVVSGRLAEEYTGTVLYDGKVFHVVHGRVVS